jgi:hypothetical protein
MPDLETRLPDLLRDLATEATGTPATAPLLRRARRRRAANVSFAAALAAAVAVASVVGIRALTPPQRHLIGGGGGSSSEAPAFPGIWPETTAADLSTAQAQVDDGHSPLRLDAAQTASMLATSLFGWSPGDVGFDRRTVVDDHAFVRLVNLAFGDSVPPIDVQLERLARSGSDGIWTVVDVSGPLFDGSPTVVLDRDTITVAGRLTDLFDGSSVHVDVLSGATEETSVADTAVVPVASARFSVSVDVRAADLASAVVWIRVEDATGGTLGASAVALGALGDGRHPADGPPALPAAVASTREALLGAVGTYDFGTIRRLIDPNTFSYNFDDGSDPIPAWKRDPSVLDPIPDLLALPPSAPKDIQGYGTFYVWPYLVDSDLKHLTAGEIDDLHALGFDDAAIEGMRRFGSYTGPRLSIDERGLWRNYVTGGD